MDVLFFVWLVIAITVTIMTWAFNEEQDYPTPRDALKWAGIYLLFGVTWPLCLVGYLVMAFMTNNWKWWTPSNSGSSSERVRWY